MTTNTEEQPKPKATDRKPMWPEVISYVVNNYGDAEGADTVTKLVADMEARHKTGIERYGVALTSGNGRNHLIDAYQEYLDGAVYLRTWLDEQGIEPMMPTFAQPTNDRRPLADGAVPPPNVHEKVVLYMFASTIEMLLQIRGMLS